MPNNENRKPPLGIIPRWEYDWQRVITILDAMERYAEAREPIPKAWVKELKDRLEVK